LYIKYLYQKNYILLREQHSRYFPVIDPYLKTHKLKL